MIQFLNSSVTIGGPDVIAFDITCKHEHVKLVSHLKIALIQETEESSNADGSSPNIYNVEIYYHNNKLPEVITYMKVIQVWLIFIQHEVIEISMTY